LKIRSEREVAKSSGRGRKKLPVIEKRPGRMKDQGRSSEPGGSDLLQGVTDTGATVLILGRGILKKILGGGGEGKVAPKVRPGSPYGVRNEGVRPVENWADSRP